MKEESGKASESICPDGLTKFLNLRGILFLCFFCLFVFDLENENIVIALLSALLSEELTQLPRLANFQ